jgi:uncharacterized OB-fold protein
MSSMPPLKHVLREMGPAAREFYRRLGDGALCTTACPACEEISFPPRERCARCGGAVQWRQLSGRGTVYAFTQQERGLRFIAPEVIGIVELEERVRVFGVFEAPFERLAIGQAVQVMMRPDESGLTLLAFTLTGE